MSQSARTTIVNRTDGTNRSTKPSTDSLHPHYYTTFQNYCCGPKANPTATTTTTTTQNKDLLPIPQNFKEDAESLLTDINQLLIEDLAKVAEYTSTIPNIFFDKNDHFQIQKYLIDRVMFRTLKDADIINWIPHLKTLYPIRTSGNGNCLLHAVLIAMIGVHDFSLYLRDRLAQFMNDNQALLKTHWRTERLKSDKTYGISSEDSKLDDEWKELCDLVHYENSEDGQAATHLQFLEAVHIFSIANMLHRPIIVLSEDVIRNKIGEAISVNDLFGIYLPILSSSTECINEPIVLAYDRSHFCPLQTDDVDRERMSDNLLPLYPSINHIFEQKLLPIRFLGDDMTAERLDNLLREYLRIQKVDYTFDSHSAAIQVQCAELGSKYSLTKYNFFLLYHKYAKYFFEVQKPKAIEDERKRAVERELDEYRSHYVPYDTYGRSIVKRDTSPLRTLRSNYTTNDGQSNNQNNLSYGQRYFYDDVHNNEPYIPPNSAIYVENTPTQPQQSQRSPDYAKRTLRDQNVDHTLSESSKILYPTSNPDNISNLNNNRKLMNSALINIQENDFRLNQERQRQISTEIPVQIPVQIVRPNLSSNNQNLPVYEQRPTPRELCLLCDQPFDDFRSTRICPTCDYKIRHPSSYDVLPSRPNTRSRSTNLYLSGSDHGYSPILSPTPKTRSVSKIICPHCRNPNLLQNLTYNSEYRCSACQNTIPSGYRY